MMDLLNDVTFWHWMILGVVLVIAEEEGGRMTLGNQRASIRSAVSKGTKAPS